MFYRFVQKLRQQVSVVRQLLYLSLTRNLLLYFHNDFSLQWALLYNLLLYFIVTTTIEDVDAEDNADGRQDGGNEEGNTTPKRPKLRGKEKNGISKNHAGYVEYVVGIAIAVIWIF